MTYPTQTSLRTVITVLLLFFFYEAEAQSNKIRYEVEADAIATSKRNVPFWLRSNQFGSIPLTGLSSSFVTRIHKPYSLDSLNDGKKKLVDWGLGLDARANIGKKANLTLIEAYAKARLGIFQVIAGRTKDVMGLNGDTLLSSGNFAVSGNSLGIPKVEISIPNYWTLPIFDGVISIKGTFSHGWIGHTLIEDTLRADPPSKAFHAMLTSRPETYFHQKSFYARLGKKDWKMKLYGGFNHQVFWGNEHNYYGSIFPLSNLQTFKYVILGKAYGNNDVPRSKIGNQLGSIDLGVEYAFKSVKMLIYRQNFYDVGALAKLANIKDGLNGIAIQNLNYESSESKRGFFWKKLLFEFLYTKNQAGELNSKFTLSGDEDYYNNTQYLDGWLYKQQGIGTPFITPKSYSKKGQASYYQDNFINNRVIAIHLGFLGRINNWNIQSKVSVSRNYGTFGTSEIGHSQGLTRFKPSGGIFKPVNQASTYLGLEKELKNNYKIGFTGAFDYGELLNNSTGVTFKIIKEFK